jgi:hypothetical protein
LRQDRGGGHGGSLYTGRLQSLAVQFSCMSYDVNHWVNEVRGELGIAYGIELPAWTRETNRSLCDCPYCLY